jgi:hypothetical protein
MLSRNTPAGDAILSTFKVAPYTTLKTTSRIYTMAPPPYNPLLGRIRDQRRLHNDTWFASYGYLEH